MFQRSTRPSKGRTFWMKGGGAVLSAQRVTFRPRSSISTVAGLRA